MPNLINVIFTLTIGVIIKFSSLDERTKKISFLILVWAALTFVTGTRGIYALNDTDSYFNTYIAAKNISFVNYINRINNDYLYYIVSWFFSNLGLPWQLYLILHSGFIFGVFCFFIYKNSEDPVLSMLIFECVFLNAWQTAMRQSLGMAFILLAYEFLKRNDRKHKILAFIFYVGAVMCHSTALVCVAFILIRKLPVNIFSVFISILGIVISFVLRDNLLSFVNVVAKLLNRNTYTEFWTHNPTTLIILCVLILIIMIYFHKLLIEKYKCPNEYFYALFLMLGLLSLGGGAMVRMAWYFGVAVCLVMPLIAKCFKPLLLTKTIMITLLLFLYIRSVNISQWYFFWQGK